MSGVGNAPHQQPSPRRTAYPIELLQTPIAGAATHVRPILLLSAFYLAFPALVADPVLALSWALIPLAIIQIAYCEVCLPAAGSSTKGTKRAQKIKGIPTKKPSDGPLSFTKISHVVVSLLLTTTSIPFLLAIQILFGAPLTTHLPHTLLSSAHLAVLAVFPLIYVHGIDGSKWLEILSAQSPFDEVYGAAVGAAVGAWLGAVPIPLDWDREWQKWPVTIITGIYLGYVAGKGVGGWLVKGERIRFD